MTNGKRKGKEGELELSHELQKYGFDTRRGQQFCGANGDADVVGIDGLHIECKRVEHLDYYKAMEQSEHDALEHEIPVVIHRKNRKKWLVTMNLDDFIKIFKGDSNESGILDNRLEHDEH